MSWTTAAQVAYVWNAGPKVTGTHAENAWTEHVQNFGATRLAGFYSGTLRAEFPDESTAQIQSQSDGTWIASSV